MKITRRFTTPGHDVFESVNWTKRSSRITDPNGSVIFEVNDVEVPESWSQLATDIVVSKYFRKAGVPQLDPETGDPFRDEQGEVITGPERSVREVVYRLAGCWRYWGEKEGYFDTPEDADAFRDEICHMLLHQMSAPNSPQWFNTGLHWAYGINGPAQGHWVPDPETGEVRPAEDAYTHPQPHACFIQSVDDDLVNPGGIMDLWTREARLFKYGSGTGTNFSSLRGEEERLSGGGKSSGLMSWLRIGDRAAGAIKSGGTTRRAAKMVCLDLDHPDIEQFVNWKVREELKVAALVEGMKHLDEDQREVAERLGLNLDYDFNGEAYYTVSGQNSNNSVRISDDFFHALDHDQDWELIQRTDGEVAKTLPARDLWNQITYAAWKCADPGVQFDTTINAWHTCPLEGRINASNPCSEYMFLDNTACNLASINLLKFYDVQTRRFKLDDFEHAVRLWTITLEISVLMAAYPSMEIAKLSYRYRTLGLGHANVGALLMQAGIPYDSDEGRAVCASLSAILTGRAYATSAEMAEQLGSFAGFAKNRTPMLRVIRNHRWAAHGVPRDDDRYEQLPIRPIPIDHEVMTGDRVPIENAAEMLKRAVAAWDDTLTLGERVGFRNAQVSVLAPTGTIGLLMDCDTTGVEPDFALVKFKKLAGGGYFKIANNSLRPALEMLGYKPDEIREILRYVLGTLTLDVEVPGEGVTLSELLSEKGFHAPDLEAIGDRLPGVFELSYAFSAWDLSDELFERIGIDIEQARANPSFNLLAELGLTDELIETLNQVICGTQTIEGAPHLKPEHLPVFDCANRCGKIGQRFITMEGHIRMMGAAQSFISGAISKTINLPTEAPVEDIKNAYRMSWELGLKANALYRDGCKLSQPLITRRDDAAILNDEDEDPEAVEAAKEEVLQEAARIAQVIAQEQVADARVVTEVIERIVERPLRRRLPDTRDSVTHKFNVAGHEGYVTVGLYENGSPGELFITMAKEGSTIGGLMDSLGTAVSVAMQYGVPIESLVHKFTNQRFEPAGMTTNPDIPFAKSLVDYIFRWMGIQFIPGYREASVPNLQLQRSSATQMDQAAKRTESDDESDPIRHDADENTRCSNIKPTDDSEPTDGPGRMTTSLHAEVADSTQLTVHVAGDRVRIADASPKSALTASMAENMGDAPPCDVCGEITVRNGTCYRCLNCGNSLGCS
ncbi:MAG: adenosylcobalamin-dependent ribonucleoside-diphosphate reductase [Phycisphaerales bacterium]|nr:adenosylcobalamin-dependent ribonucleoside-diphosphate reductase [Phycisphaerales bacterium]